MYLFWFVLLPILIALIGYILHSKIARTIVLFSQVIYMMMSLMLFIQVRYYGAFTEVMGHYTTGVGIALRADSIATIFVLVTSFLFGAMLLYNYHKPYMNELFLFLFMVLQGLIYGIFLTQDLFNMYVLIEVSTIVVSILIMFKKDSQSIYDGMVYLLTNLVSMTFFLLAVGYFYYIFGTEDLTIIKESLPLLTSKESIIIPYSLLITAIGLKSAIMPLFSWLPRAHGTPSAPSIVSAILSGLYVKGGVYLFIRIQDVFGDYLNTHYIFLVFGLLTAIIGFVFAISQTDIKLILAYHTVSQIGLIIYGLSLNNDYSYYGSIYHIVNHAIFKSTLFLTAGIIIEEYETRNIKKIRGVFRRMPFVATSMIFAMLGITGAPLFNGSVSKYLIQKGSPANDFLEYILLFINLGTIISFVKYSSMLFGATNKKSKVRKNESIAIGFLSFTCFIGGVFGFYFVEYFFGIHAELTLSAYIEKLLTYLVSLLIGFLFYQFAYHRLGLFHKIREVELTFNQIVGSIVIFFTFFLGYMMNFHVF